MRALQKAGLTSLTSLKAASLETLLAVPGMSQIKAQHIRDYLAQFPHLKDGEARTEAKVGKKGKKESAGAKAEANEGSLAAQAAAQAIALLTSEPAYAYRAQLLRELSRFACLMRSLPAEKADGLSRRLERLLGELPAVASGKFDRKSQTALAETLSEISDRINPLKPILEATDEDTPHMRDSDKKKKGKNRDA